VISSFECYLIINKDFVPGTCLVKSHSLFGKIPKSVIESLHLNIKSHISRHVLPRPNYLCYANPH